MVSPFLDSACVSFELEGQCIQLSPGEVRPHRHGMEFFSCRPYPTFAVLEVSIRAPGGEARATCSGVVVASEPREGGTRHLVTVLFLDLPDGVAAG